MKKKGFTLIELLAVIVILAIIALIAVPVIMNIITSARKSAFEDTAYGLISAGEMYYASSLLENGMKSDVEFTITDGKFIGENKLEVKGALPTSGKITVTKEGKVIIAVNNGVYCITKTTSESKIQTDNYEGSCEYRKALNPIITTNAECLKDTTKTCTSAEINTDDGVQAQIKVNNNETKTFYVVKDDTTTNTLTLMMDSNLGETVEWISKTAYITAGGTETDYGDYGNNNKGPITALNYLESQTSGWTNIASQTYTLTDSKYGTMTRANARARMLTETEARALINSHSDWVYGNLNDWDKEPPRGYWISSASAVVSHTASGVSHTGSFSSASTYAANIWGVRPVIEIPKTII